MTEFKPQDPIQLAPEIIGDIEKRFAELCRQGKQIEATSPKVNINQRPDYFDEARFEKAQKTLMKYYSNTQLSSTVGLILLLQLESILVPLLKTGRSSSVVNLWDRYVTTSKYTKTFYENKFYDQSTEAWRYILLVRGMHQRIYKLMNEQHPNLLPSTENTNESDESKQQQPVVWVNQYDMALTQFAFIGLFLLQPKLCAAHSIKEEELLDIVYFWRLLSYYFGIEDRFNIFAYDGEWLQQKYFLQLLMDQCYRKELSENRQKIGTEMAKGLMLAFEDLASESTFNILDHWWNPYVSLSGLDQLEPYTKLELYKLARFLFVFKVLFKNQYLRSKMNEMYRKKFDKFHANGDKIKKKLSKKYGHLRYEG